jgi:2-phospho-L-lactate guanylyltransferase
VRTLPLWVIIPVKPLDEAKSRLATSLSPEQRALLARELLTHTLQVVGQVPAVTQVMVLTRQPGPVDLVGDRAVQLVEEIGNAGLNPALQAAAHLAIEQGAQAVLILPADLPKLAVGDLERLVALADPPPVVVVAPDRHHEGTNALLCAPPSLIEYQFGPESLRLHQAQARLAGARLEVCDLPGLALDIDLPEDLDLLRSQGPDFLPPDLGLTG